MLVSVHGLLYQSRIQNEFLVSTVFVSFSNSLNIHKASYMSLPVFTPLEQRSIAIVAVLYVAQ